MFVHYIVRRQLESLLRPWLRDEPELELRLGLINSHATARNLSFDASALNLLLDESFQFSFKEVRVEEFSVHFSNWSVEAFKIEVRGVSVTLSAGEVEERSLRRGRKSSELENEERRKILAGIDPEGCALHDILEKILATTPRNHLKISLSNLVLKHCHVQIVDINLQVQVLTSNGTLVCLLKLNELNARPQYLEYGCLLRGLIGATFRHLKETFVAVDFQGFEVGYAMDDQTKIMFPNTDMFMCIKLNDLQIAELSVCVPKLSMSFSPLELTVILALSKISMKESKHARNGRQLWKLAANRLGFAVSSLKFSFHNLVGLVCLWLRYLNAYEKLLSVVGNPGDLLSKTTTSKMLQDNLFLSSAKHNWEVIISIEKDLPAEAIAQARRIARDRVASCVQHGEDDGDRPSSISAHVNYLSKMFLAVLFLWNMICRIFLSIVNFFLLLMYFLPEQEPDEQPEDHCPQYFLLLNFGKVSINFIPKITVQNVEQVMEPPTAMPYLNIHSLHLSIDALLLMYCDHIVEQTLSVSCGMLEVKSSPVVGVTTMQRSSRFNSSKRHQKGNFYNPKRVLKAEPAVMFSSSQATEKSAAGQADNVKNPQLKEFLEEMCLNWKKTLTKYDGIEIEYSKDPWLLFETKNSLAYAGPRCPDSGFWKCCLIVGKLNLCLEYSSILSMIILFGQIQHALNWNRDHERLDGPTHFRSTTEHELHFSWEQMHDSCARKMKMALLKLLPDKCIQLGAFITGPCIRILLQKDGFNYENADMNSAGTQDSFDLGFDVHNIEVVVWPTSKSNFSSTKWASFGYVEPECQIRKPRIIEIPKSDNEKYASQEWVSLSSFLSVNGFNFYIEDLAEGQQISSFVLRPIALHLSFFRESVYTLAKTITAFSAALCSVFTGFTILSNMDELYVLFQAVAGLSSALSYASGTSDNFKCAPLEVLEQRKTVIMESGNVEIASQGTPLIHTNLLVSANSTFIFKSVDIVLSSRVNELESDVGFSRQKLADRRFPDCGIWNSVPKSSVKISFEEEKLEILLDLFGVQSVIFRLDNMSRSFDHSLIENLMKQSNSWLYEASLSNWSSYICLGRPLRNSDESSSSNAVDDSLPYTADNALIKEFNISHGQSFIVADHLDFAAPSSHWMLVIFTLDGFYVGRCSLKKFFFEAQQLDKFTSSISVGKNLQAICWEIKGGHLLLEAKALVMFVRSFASYLRLSRDLVSIILSFDRSVQNAENRADETMDTAQQNKWQLPAAFTIDVTQISVVLIADDDPGCLQELVCEVGVHLLFESKSLMQKLKIDLSRIAVLTQVLEKYVENEDQVPHFSSVPVNESSSNSTMTSLNRSGRQQNHILHHLAACLTAERPNDGHLHLNQVWIGRGSVSGFDMIISLSDTLMISSILSSLSTVSNNNESTNELKENHWNNGEGAVEDMVPDGAIVAIQDVYQHMYYAVQEGQNKHGVVGVIHYSLVGKEAFFKVKHYKQRIWKSSVLWFSLISLHAKSDSGEPLQLSYRPGSVFVELSGTNNGGKSLWKAVPCQTESYQSEVDLELNNRLTEGTFYLVNKKNDCGVAFIDGTPEFIRKPGNPFKFKVIQSSLDRYSLEASDANLHPGICEDKEQTSEKNRDLPCIQLKIDNVSLTIVHELLDTKDRFPLLRACLHNTQLNVQLFSYKVRVMSTISMALHYFDAQRNFWRELVCPVDIFVFYRSSFLPQGSNPVEHGVPVHIYCRTEEWNISLTEVSMDILLFVIGKLNLAGPFSVQSSTILANCCKVENHSGLNLICHFFDGKRVTIARKQSASVFLRHPLLENQQPEGASILAIQLSDLGSFVTSSLHLSLVKAKTFAWRTRITSLQDSRSYPGPFIVVSVSRNSEDGLSVVVSPLLRIHNETEFSMELRFRRPQQDENIFASVSLKKGDSVDDSMATFDAINMSGGLKKALMSLSVGNFLMSFRPEIGDGPVSSGNQFSVEWSDELEGGKAVRLSGIFDKLGYQVRRALSVESVKCSFSTACCSIKSEDAPATNLHFLIQSIGRNVPVLEPANSQNGSEIRNSAVILQEQKEIFLLPTVRVSNLLHMEIHLSLTETDVCPTAGSDCMGKQAIMASGSTIDFYANPALMCLTVTLTAFNSSCKPVKSGDWVKKLLKNKNTVKYLDIDLDFAGGKYSASLRLSRGLRGILEAAVFTPYSLKNDTEFSLYFFAHNQKPLSRDELDKLGSCIAPEFGLLLSPNSVRSWFLKSHKIQLRMSKGHASETLLDLDALSGLTEISLAIEETGAKCTVKFGIYIRSSSSKLEMLAQTLTMVPRHVVFNESEENITVRQCYLENESAGMCYIRSKQRTTLLLQNGVRKSREFSLFENVIKKHRHDTEASVAYIQFQPNDSESSWSGPVCIASLGCFFLKFRKQTNQAKELDNTVTEFAAVNVVEERSTLGVHFYKPPNISLPYRIENQLHQASLTYYQKDSSERELLGPGCSAHYVWDDWTLPHRLVVLVNDMHLLREIKLDKVRAWKPFLRPKQSKGLASLSLLDKKYGGQNTYFGQFNSMDTVNVGYEVYAEGPTRVLQICELSDNRKGDYFLQTHAKIRIIVSQFAIHLLECGKQDSEENEDCTCTPIVTARLTNINLGSVVTDQQKHNQLTIQSLYVDEKWTGAPFAAMLRRHQLEFIDSNACTLKVVFVLLSRSSSIRQVKYSSIVLQPIDLNLDEETLMKIASFWRTSLSDSSTPSQQYYFDHFEVHPVKIITNFLPGDSYSSYNSAQETLRSLLHSVVKVPPIKNMVVELNGILITHALITMRELVIRAAQHYSWYAMRAIYIAKGSTLLPPSFASIFDDLASSSLDVFFDPSRGLINLPGFTLGTFKFISKSIKGKGFSGTKRYFGDLEKTLKTAGSKVLFAVVTEISDSVLKGAETSGFDGMLSGFHQGILKLAMEPSLLGTALMEGGPNRKIKLDRGPGVDELYIEGYLQAMLDTMYRQEYLRVRVIDDQVLLKNLPPNSALIDEIMDRVKGFLVSKGLLKGDPSKSSHHLRHLQGEAEWKIVPTVITLCEHLFVSFAIRMLRKHTVKYITNMNWRKVPKIEENRALVRAEPGEQEKKVKFRWKWGISKFVLSGILAYIDGRLCRYIPNPVARRIVSGYLLSFIDKNDDVS
ncbi:hypothetical protein K2173_006249 [Erythroxylum novogranatense]|uniref:Vacuolar protein sorting-associated protein 13 VPS13 adaptor binding domain-containing protein n=1 Tax=Erythroxylum novogranatense TaxID=1862640 RepID=A0AAV8TE83_9ROSI|nr:hypothetical protein K2173_006249 [Erythroxylum novogranatense]